MAKRDVATLRPRWAALASVVAVMAVACGDDDQKPAWDSSEAGAGYEAGGHASGGAATAGAADVAGRGGADAAAVAFVPYFGPGKRLEPIVHSSAGVDLFTGLWFDTELGVPCAFQPDTPDGVCLPQGTAKATGFYLDDACSIHAALVLPSGCADAPEPLVALGPSETECGDQEPYAIAGPKLEKPVTLYYSPGPDSCEVFTDGTSDSPYDYYPAERMERSVLVTSALAVRDHAENLRVSAREGSDGSWVVDGLFDTEREAPCAPAETGLVPRDRCLPSNLPAFDELFLDEACEQPAVAPPLPPSCSARVPRAGLHRLETNDSCPSTSAYEILALGEMATAPTFRIGTEDTCTSAGPDDRVVYPSLERIDLATLPRLDQLFVEAGPLRLPFFGSAGQPFMPAGGFENSDGEPCEATRFSDGALRCVPRTWLRGSLAPTKVFFSEPDCSGDPVMIWNVESCLAETPPRGILVPEPTCAGAMEQAREAVPFAGASVYSQQPGEPCLEAPVPSLEGLRLYALGETLDPGQEFPALEYRE